VLESLKMVNNEKKYKTEHQVKEVKISTTVHSINHCQKWKFLQKSSSFGLW